MSDDEVDDEQVPTTPAAVGASQQRPSWIWFTGNICENIQDPVTCTGEYFFEAFLGSIVLIEYQHCGLNGQNQEHGLIGGRKRWYCCVRRCASASRIAAGRRLGG